MKFFYHTVGLIEYEDLTLKLATNSEKLSEIRNKLKINRNNTTHPVPVLRGHPSLEGILLSF